jgi:hypothetical protein
MTRKLKGGAIVDSSVTGTQIETTLVNKITNAYNQANAAYGQANTGSTSGVDAYNQANTAYGQANTAYGQANNARSDANTTFATINTTFGTVNTSLGTVNTSLVTINTNYQAAYAQANTARDTANNAYGSANLAYAAANNSNLKTGGAIVGDISITGNLFVNGVQTVVNTASLTVNDPIFLLANNNTTNAVGLGFVAHYGATQQHTGLIRAHQDEKWYLFDSYNDHILYSNNVLDTANTKLATLRANIEANTLSVVNGVSGNVNFDSGTLFVDSVGNEVGIGTTTPSAELHIYKSTGPTINLQAGSSGAGGLKIIKGDSGSAYINNIDAQDLVLATNNTNRIIIGGSGLVGINTATIPERLTINGNIKLTTGSAVYVENPAGGRTGALFTDSTGTELRSHTGSGEPLTLNAPDTTAYIALETAGGERVRIANTGSVGIGTTNPSERLTVVGVIESRGNASDPNYAAFLRGIYDSAHALQLGVKINSGTESEVFGVYADGGGANPRVVINPSNGWKVGIANTNPQGALQVSTSSGYNLYLDKSGGASIQFARSGTLGYQIDDSSGAMRWLSGGSTEKMRIASSGNLGINTTNPGQLLDVVGASSTNAWARILGGAGGTSGGIVLGNNDGGNLEYGRLFWNNANNDLILSHEYTSGSLIFRTNSGERMRITSTGNFGIGTNSPSYKLHIQEGGITAAAISSGWPAYNAELAAQSKTVLYLDAGGNGAVSTGGTGASVVVLMGQYNDARGIITMAGAGGATPSDAGMGYGRDLMIKGGNSDNGNGLVGGRLFLAGGSGYSGGAFGSNYGAVVLQPQGGGVGIGITNPSNNFHVRAQLFYLDKVNYTAEPTIRFRSANDSYASEWGVGQLGSSNHFGFRYYDGVSGWAERVRITTSGEVLVGISTNSGYGGGHRIYRSVSEGGYIMSVDGGVEYGSLFQAVSGAGYSSAAAAQWIGKNSSTNRSINAGGTVNASGADYAEYMEKSDDFIIAKGDICGINSNGKLTNIYNDAISFVVKSTDPSYVGGDNWGAGFKDDPEGLEEARQKVDRIAFAGQVPVNVTGATPGQYIIPVNNNGMISGATISNPTFEQYQISVGKVVAIEQDGRARIIVKVA